MRGLLTLVVVAAVACSDDIEKQPPPCACVATTEGAAIKVGNKVTIDAEITNPTQVSCDFRWTLAKEAGTPTVNVAPGQGAITLGPGQTEKVSIELHVPDSNDARTDAKLKLEVTGDAACEAKEDVCVLPWDDSTKPGAWGSNQEETLFRWDLTIEPTTTRFDTRAIREVTGTGPSTDDCWFQGSAFPKMTGVGTGSGNIHPGNRMIDNVGLYSLIVGYYRLFNRAPCSSVAPQDLEISCRGGWEAFTTGVVGHEIGVDTFTSIRDGRRETRRWP